MGTPPSLPSFSLPRVCEPGGVHQTTNLGDRGDPSPVKLFCLSLKVNISLYIEQFFGRTFSLGYPQDFLIPFGQSGYLDFVDDEMQFITAMSDSDSSLHN